jgi:hypothetical protein
MSKIHSDKPFNKTFSYRGPITHENILTYLGVVTTRHQITKEFSKRPSPRTLNDLLSKNFYTKITGRSIVRHKGKVAKKMGPIPSKVLIKPASFVGFAKSEDCPERYRRDTSLDISLSGGFTNYQKGYEVLGLNRTRDVTSCARSTRAITSLIGKLKWCGYIGSEPRPEDCFLSKVPMETLPGGDWSRIYKKKQDAYVTAAACAEKISNDIKDGYDPKFTLMTMGAGKEKRNFDKELHSVIKSRPLEQEDFTLLLLGKPWFEPFEKYIMASPNPPMKIGSRTTCENINWISLRQRVYKYGLEGDADNNDAYVTSEDIGNAISIVRGFYPEGEYIDNMFYIIGRSLCRRTLVTEDRHVLSLVGSISTGCFITCLLTSLVTCIRLERVITEYGGFRTQECFYDVLGDDFLIYFNKLPNLDIPKLQEWIWQKLAYRVTIGKVGKCINKDPDLSLEFLKHVSYYDKDGYIQTTATPIAVFKRMNTPQYKSLNTFKKANEFLLSNCDAYLNHPLAIQVAAGHYVYLLNEYGMVKTEDIKSKIIEVYNDILVSSDALYKSVFNGEYIPPLLRKPDDERKCVIDISSYDSFSKGNMDNWLYDNYDRNHTPVPSRRDRMDWFTLQMSHRSNLSNLITLIKSKTNRYFKDKRCDGKKLATCIRSYIRYECYDDNASISTIKRLKRRAKSIRLISR